MSAYVELAGHVTFELVEQAYRTAVRRQEAGQLHWTDAGWRAARARDPKLLKVLEHCTEVLDKADEAQRGRTRRCAEKLSEQVATTETQLFREAYRTADMGDPAEPLRWIYGAAAWICGYSL